MACIIIGLVVRLLVTFLLVHFGGFNLKEKVFIAVAWLPKATVQVRARLMELTQSRSEAAVVQRMKPHASLTTGINQLLN